LEDAPADAGLDADGSEVALLATPASPSAEAGRFLAGGVVEELAVGSVPLSPSPPPPDPLFLATPPRKAVTSQIVTGAGLAGKTI
jgi:hypothetical protein